VLTLRVIPDWGRQWRWYLARFGEFPGHGSSRSRDMFLSSLSLPLRSFPPVLWNVYGDCDNYATLKGHSGAVMELHYNTDGR